MRPIVNAASPQGFTPTFSAEKGKFRIRVNGQDTGSEEFEISKNGENWVARGNSEIRGAQGTARVTGALTLRADGTPVRYEWSTQGPKKASAAIVFDGARATSDLRMQGAKDYTQQFTFPSSHVAILDNNLYDQYIVLARLYDQKAGGTQRFSVLVPQELTPGTVTVESLGAQDVNGKNLRELRVQTPDNEIDLYLDGAELVRIVAPAANAEITRE
ncbi:MAG TPA: hypothetical protein VN661_12820 [Candidatus Acidoferrales bacterium]|nr:hypothetical protein [Candidatus Acidoferrales bacterium]